MLDISSENGFIEISTSSLSSKVFEKNNKIYKINKRNSYQRASADLKVLLNELSDFSMHIPETKISVCVYNGEQYTCIEQNKINGKELSSYDPEELKLIVENKKNKDFLKKLISYFSESIKLKKLYPDLVGNPKDPHIRNSINILVDESGHLVLCDVGLSPHEDTLIKHGESFFESDNVKLYLQKIEESARDLNLY